MFLMHNFLMRFLNERLCFHAYLLHDFFCEASLIRFHIILPL
jgi:hypothetical protein